MNLWQLFCCYCNTHAMYPLDEPSEVHFISRRVYFCCNTHATRPLDEPSEVPVGGAISVVTRMPFTLPWRAATGSFHQWAGLAWRAVLRCLFSWYVTHPSLMSRYWFIPSVGGASLEGRTLVPLFLICHSPSWWAASGSFHQWAGLAWRAVL